MATAGPATKTRWTDSAVNGRSRRPPATTTMATYLVVASFVRFFPRSFVRVYFSR